MIEKGHAKKVVEFCASILFDGCICNWNNSWSSTGGGFSGELFCFAGLAFISGTSFNYGLFKT